jgi:hypothetical protein
MAASEWTPFLCVVLLAEFFISIPPEVFGVRQFSSAAIAQSRNISLLVGKRFRHGAACGPLQVIEAGSAGSGCGMVKNGEFRLLWTGASIFADCMCSWGVNLMLWLRF